MGPLGQGGTVALLFHGGAWVGGHPVGLRDHCVYLARNRVTAVSAQYRMLPRGSPTIVHESVVDACDAASYVLHRLKPEKLFLVGASSGGALAIHAACARPERVAGVILFNPAVDLTARTLASLPRGMTKDVSPLHMTIDRFPRTLILQGEKDEVTRPGAARRFTAALRRAGVEVELRMFPDASHAFYVPQPYRAATFGMMRDFIQGRLPGPAKAEQAPGS